MNKLRAIKTTLFVAAMSAIITGAASASVAAPTFDISTLRDPIYTLGGTVLAGITVLLVVVFGVKGPFILVRMGLDSVKKLFGRSKPAVN